MARAPHFDPALVPVYLRNAQPTASEVVEDPRGADADRAAAVKWLLGFSLAGRKAGIPPRPDVAEFFASEASRIATLPDPAAAFDQFINGHRLRGRPLGADPESFGAVDMVNARREADPRLSIEAACAVVAAELGQAGAGVRKRYYRWRGERDTYRAKLARGARTAKADLAMRMLEAAPIAETAALTSRAPAESERPDPPPLLYWAEIYGPAISGAPPRFCQMRFDDRPGVVPARGQY